MSFFADVQVCFKIHVTRWYFSNWISPWCESISKVFLFFNPNLLSRIKFLHDDNFLFKNIAKLVVVNIMHCHAELRNEKCWSLQSSIYSKLSRLASVRHVLSIMQMTLQQSKAKHSVKIDSNKRKFHFIPCVENIDRPSFLQLWWCNPFFTCQTTI